MINTIKQKITKYKNRLKAEDLQLYSDYAIALFELTNRGYPKYEREFIGDLREILDPCRKLTGDELQAELDWKKISLKDITINIEDEHGPDDLPMISITTGSLIPNPKYPEYLKELELWKEGEMLLMSTIEELETKLAKKIASWELNNES